MVCLLWKLQGISDLGIEGTCGGSISCCTCHIVIDKKWFEITGPPNPDEEDMLDLAVGFAANLQIRMSNRNV